MISFDPPSIARFQELAGEVLASGQITEGPKTRAFEAGFSEFTGLPAASVASGGFALWALCEAAGVRGHDVIVPTNTFMATPLAVERAGGRVVYADVSRADLCLDVPSIEAVISPRTRAVVVVHIGGHIAFAIDEIAEFCRRRGLILIEDCAHAHGASWHGRPAGAFGFGGAYSFYATKTLTTGEGGMVVSRDPQVVGWVTRFRNYGKPDFAIDGFHGRINELAAALGVVQLERAAKILAWKRALAARYDRIFPRRVVLPAGMISGYYKYIVFDEEVAESTGKVYADPCHRLRPGDAVGHFPESEWIAAHHACPPIWYGWPGAEQAADDAALAARLRAGAKRASAIGA